MNQIEKNQEEKTMEYISTSISDELKQSYLSYAQTVITDRALPDARDGLKPVQRRILFTMRELGLAHDASYKKSARIVGDTMGKYHPHGDSAIYDTMARMAQDFTMECPLVDGQGNFGSVDGDSPAAMRYTEARLSQAGEMMLDLLDEETVPFEKNFDETLYEPTILPAAFPTLLINGVSGIAVGMSTSMPPHNPHEILILLADMAETDREFSLDEIFKRIHGPDFPTGGTFFAEDLKNIYASGRGKGTLRSTFHWEDAKRGKKTLVLTEIPWSVSKSQLIENIGQLVQANVLDEIRNIRDESDRHGIRIILECRSDTDETLLLEKLRSKTSFEITISIINLALVNGVPKELSFHELCKIHIAHRKTVFHKSITYRMKKASDRLHLVNGFLRVLSQEMFNTVIDSVRKAKTSSDAVKQLCALGFSQKQSEAICDMRLGKLSKLEETVLEKEKEELEKKITQYKTILSDDKTLCSVVAENYRKMAEIFTIPRKTHVSLTAPDVNVGQPTSVLKASERRNTNGYFLLKNGMYGFGPNPEESLFFFVENDSRRILCVSETARMKLLEKTAFNVPKNGLKPYFGAEKNILFVSPFDDTTDSSLFLVSRKGKILRCRPEGFQPQGLTGNGVLAMTLEKDDSLMTAFWANDTMFIHVSDGYGKEKYVPVTEILEKGRGGQGVFLWDAEQFPNCTVRCCQTLPVNTIAGKRISPLKESKNNM